MRAEGRSYRKIARALGVGESTVYRWLNPSEPQEGPTEPIWYLRSIAHSAYLQTHHWRRRRSVFLDSFTDKSCGLCGLAERDETRELPIKFHVHHVSYARLGYELDDDLILLCAPCHNLVHFPDSRAARHWLMVCANDDGAIEERARELIPPELVA